MNAAKNHSASNPQPPNPPNPPKPPQPLPPPQRPVYPEAPTAKAAVAPTAPSVPEIITESDASAVSSAPANKTRSHPIPPPSNPRQNRAIGLVQGRYQHSEEQLTRGVLIAEDETEIEAVLLGRVISLVKNHLDLSQPHLWVVYPRTRQKDECLHLQIVGVWEPETLGQPADEPEEMGDKETETAVTKAPEATTDTSSIESGYFSIRGEVVFNNPEKAEIVVKVRQAPKKDEENSKFFKLNLIGRLPDKALGHFWDLQVQLSGDKMMIQRATDLGRISKKNLLKKGGGKSRHHSEHGAKRKFSDSSAKPRGKRQEHHRPLTRKAPLPKPTPPSKTQDH